MTNGGRIGSRNVPGVDSFSGVWSVQERADATREGFFGYGGLVDTFLQWGVGSAQQIAIPNNSLINTGGPYTQKTVEALFRSGGDITTRQVLWQQGGSTNGINFYCRAGGLYAGAWSNNASPSFSVFINTPIAPDTEYHAALVYDQTADTLRLVLDGVDAASASLGGGGALATHLGLVAIGRVREGTRYDDIGGVEGERDQLTSGWVIRYVRYWNAARTTPELAANRNTGLDASTPGLVAQWALNEGTGMVAADTINGINGTIEGSPPPAWGVAIS